MEIINNAPLRNAPTGIALIIDKDNGLLGLVTDGDIRRAILKNADLSRPIETIMNSHPICVKHDMTNEEKIKFIGKKLRINKMQDIKINYIPVLDGFGKIIDLVTFFDLWKRTDIKTRNVCILGLGYVGLTLAVTFTDVGIDVYGVDINEDLIKDLEMGTPHFHEVGLMPLLKRYIDKKLFVSTKINPNLVDIYIICVDTPVDENKKPHMGYIESVSKNVGRALKKDDLVVLRSTVPIGTSRDVVLPILEKESGLRAGDDFYFVCAPERTIEGEALKELRELPQIIGGVSKESINVASNLFREIAPTIVDVGSLEAAEMIKLVNNTFRDVSFAYANELALICDKLNLDTVELIKAATKGYPRNKVPFPSPGVGGPCMTKDPYIFLDVFKKTGIKPKMVELARTINEFLPIHVVRKISNYFETINKPMQNSKIFVIGFAFKGYPETSDMRGSTTLTVINELKKFTSNIYGYDSVVDSKEIEKLGVKFSTVKEGFEKADCVIIMNNHNSYRNFDIYSLLSTMNKPSLFFDSWHIFQPGDVRKIEGITYGGLGND